MEKDGRQRKHIRIDMEVAIVRKEDQRTGELTEGKVAQLLTKSPHHPHGIKVRLHNGAIGRVKRIM